MASVIRHQHTVLPVFGGTWNWLPTGRTPEQSSALLWLRPRFTSLKLLPSDERASSRRRRFFLAFGRGFLRPVSTATRRRRARYRFTVSRR